MRVVSLARDTPTGPPLHPLPNIIKLSQTIWELWPTQDFNFRGDNYITKKVRVISLARELPSVLLFIPTKYYQNMSRVSKLWMHLCTDGRTYQTDVIRLSLWSFIFFNPTTPC